MLTTAMIVPPLFVVLRTRRPVRTPLKGAATSHDQDACVIGRRKDQRAPPLVTISVPEADLRVKREHVRL